MTNIITFSDCLKMGLSVEESLALSVPREQLKQACENLVAGMQEMQTQGVDIDALFNQVKTAEGGGGFDLNGLLNHPEFQKWLPYILSGLAGAGGGGLLGGGRGALGGAIALPLIMYILQNMGGSPADTTGAGNNDSVQPPNPETAAEAEKRRAFTPSGTAPAPKPIQPPVPAPIKPNPLNNLGPSNVFESAYSALEPARVEKFNLMHPYSDPGTPYVNPNTFAPLKVDYQGAHHGLYDNLGTLGPK